MSADYRIWKNYEARELLFTACGTDDAPLWLRVRIFENTEMGEEISVGYTCNRLATVTMDGYDFTLSTVTAFATEKQWRLWLEEAPQYLIIHTGETKTK